MSKGVFVISEWLPKNGHEEEFWEKAKMHMKRTQKEEGCISARITKPVDHPRMPEQTKYTVVLLQQYKNVEAFTDHCNNHDIKDFFKGEMSHLVDDWRWRLVQE